MWEPREWLVLAMLAGAAILDLRNRRVANLYWLPFVAAAAVLWGADWASGRADWRVLVIAAALAGLFYGIWYLGLFGGADAKGLMVAAFLAPGILRPTSMYPLVLDALINGSLLVFLVPIGLAVRNLVSGNAAWPAGFIGTRMSLAEARNRHVWPMHRLDADGNVRWRYWQRAASTQAALYDELERAGMRYVWATPKLPFMALVLVGALAGLAWGNLAMLALAFFS